MICLCLALTAVAIGTAVQAPLDHDASHGTVPDFIRTDITGKVVHLQGYRGRLVLLNFWATWCEPCLSEIPGLVAWQRKYRAAGFQVIGVSLDERSDTVKQVYRRYRINYPVVMGDAPLAESFGGVLGLPLTLLISPDGRLLGRYQGGRDPRGLAQQIHTALRRP